MRWLLSPIILLIGLSVGLTACESCGPSGEPVLQLGIRLPSPGRIDTLYAIGSIRPLPAQPYTISTPASGFSFNVPLNLNADSSQYVFRQNGQNDTLTVFYKRQYVYRNSRCGYVIELVPPAGQTARVSQGKVSNVEYQPNSFKRTFFISPSDTGILLQIQV